MSKGRLLMTGRFGFTGHYAARELTNAGWDVWSTGLAGAVEGDAKYVPADLTQSDQVAQMLEKATPDAVLHLAAISFVKHGQAEDFYRVNLMGTRCLLEGLSERGLGQKGVVLASTANIYGHTTESPISESVLPMPVNDYSVSKLAMEYAARLFMDNLPIMLIRPFNYTGRGQDPKFLIPKIVQHFRDRAARMELGNLDVARDFSDVRDVARAYKAFFDQIDPGTVTNICSGQATRLQDIVTMCREITGHDLSIEVNPAFVRAQEIKELSGDSTRLERFLPSQARIPLRETLTWMLDGAA
ncbi:GDP-mannose 4,6-dehydratase [uncultured Ruegeria sp.]|uniref:GDP-mannose 4,6-dehydratase n=1 Tax=uncultured Ruegeria sp. TaxID=259304 RepID=UPI00260A8266|nr:GDP-mannose 4,6-dehydratase [uncultured Ruegeria sp.]